ncbi:MAG: hypothetical protein M3349_07110 [Actinomycetota bacterium]|nr:hypothetical protein [Actinomycetota bacterium]
MGSSKRDRQRANREARRVIELKQQRRHQMMARVKRFGFVAAGVVAIALVANLVWGGGGDTETPGTSTTAVVNTTLPPATSTSLPDNGSDVTSTTAAGTSTTSG